MSDAVPSLVEFVRDWYDGARDVPLHAPVFSALEKDYVVDCIDSTFVSSVGRYVDMFERRMEAFTGSPRAVAAVNGTAALHVALRLAGVSPGDRVVTQALTFVATCNAIAYCGAEPVFVDVDRATLGMSAEALQGWLEANARPGPDGGPPHAVADGRRIAACLPMHTFGHPADLDGLLEVCARWRIPLIEDAAESLGSYYKGRHTGTLGLMGTLSFNGNKTITTGGGGMVLAGEEMGTRAKYVTTTAKRPHAYEFFHDELGYNYRMPNINAALGCAQMERIDAMLASKRALADAYKALLTGTDLQFVEEPRDCHSNYWLNAVLCSDRAHRDDVLARTNAVGIMTRPIWTLMSRLPMYSACLSGDLSNSQWLEDRVVNLPSSARPC